MPSRTRMVMVISPFPAVEATAPPEPTTPLALFSDALFRRDRTPAPPRPRAEGLIGTVRVTQRGVKKETFSDHARTLNFLSMSLPSQLVLNCAVRE